MQGRKPHDIIIDTHDRCVLEQVAHSRTLSWFQVQRARTLLAMADSQSEQSVALQMQYDPSTVRRICRRYEDAGLQGVLTQAPRTGHPAAISPCGPRTDRTTCVFGANRKGLHLTHWSSEDLARQAVIDDIVTEISARTVKRILHGVNLQPHRTRYWKTARVDLNFKSRAEQIIWCYANANRLMENGFLVICADEMPNLQALQRRPIRRAIPSSIEQQEFEYIRHGSVNALLFLTVPTGQMHVRYPQPKDAAHYIEALKWFHQRHQDLRGAFLIQDGDPSHTAAQTKNYFKLTPWWRARFTPAHASWLNQGE